MVAFPQQAHFLAVMIPPSGEDIREEILPGGIILRPGELLQGKSDQVVMGGLGLFLGQLQLAAAVWAFVQWLADAVFVAAVDAAADHLALHQPGKDVNLLIFTLLSMLTKAVWANITWGNGIISTSTT
jgi:hypothetical protein